MYYIALCDDNPEYRKVLKEAVWQNEEYNPDIMTVSSFGSGEELLQEDLSQYQLTFLDMQMGEMDGYHTAKKIREKNDRMVLAFCSGLVVPLPEHFEVQPYRYFMKQIDESRMQEIIRDLLIEMKRRDLSRIEVVSDGKAVRVALDQILYMERQKRGSRLILEEHFKPEMDYYELMSNESLENWYAQLSEDGFEFVHKSYLVNMRQIMAVVKDDVLFPNGMSINMTRTYRQKFQERFAHYFGKKFRRDSKE